MSFKKSFYIHFHSALLLLYMPINFTKSFTSLDENEMDRLLSLSINAKVSNLIFIAFIAQILFKKDICNKIVIIKSELKSFISLPRQPGMKNTNTYMIHNTRIHPINGSINDSTNDSGPP